MAREDNLEGGTLELSLQEGIERDNLIGIIDRVLGQYGSAVVTWEREPRVKVQDRYLPSF